MNPFDLRGPEFLGFYVALSVVVFLGIVILRRWSESAQPPRIDLSDPLLIAFLRGGHAEVLRVATISLIDRKLLVCEGTRLQAVDYARPESVRRPAEKALLEKFAAGGEATSMFDDEQLKSTSYEYELTLTKAGLLPDESVNRVRRLIFAGALIVLGGVSLLKVLVALSRGRTNVAFLIVLTVVAIVVAVILSYPRLTESGKAMLRDLKVLYAGLKERAAILQPGGVTIEPMMLAAVFGVGALAGDGFTYAQTLFPRVRHSTSASCGSSCGTSCGSSCGGGCGGGCGGCGS